MSQPKKRLHHLIKRQQRQRMKRLIAELARDIPDIRSSLLQSLANVHHRQLLTGY